MPKLALLMIGFIVFASLPMSPAALGYSEYGESPPPHIYLGGGLISQNAGRTAVNASGGTSLWGSLYLQATLAFRLGLGETSWGLSPALSYTPLGMSGADAGEKSRLLAVDLLLFRRMGPVDLHAGPGMLLAIVSGSGGTTTLNNGSSTTVFGLPSTSTASRLFFAAGGLGFQLSRLRLDFDLWVVDLVSSRRAVYPYLNLSVGFL